MRNNSGLRCHIVRAIKLDLKWEGVDLSALTRGGEISVVLELLLNLMAFFCWE